MISTKNYKKIGITAFLTKTKGIHRAVKEAPEDFKVQEISIEGKIASLEPLNSNFIPQTSNLPYTHFTLVKRNWNQALLLRKIAKTLGVSKNRFSYAGTKDTNALTAQRISAWNLSPEQLSKLSIHDCKIGDFSLEERPLNLGDLWGNHFEIVLRNPSKNSEKTLEKFAKELKSKKGLPNFFGEQRFGTRLNNHLIGKKLIQKDVEGALKIFLTEHSPSEPEEIQSARKFLAKNWKKENCFREAIKKFPKSMHFDLMVLDRLAKYPNDFVGAIKMLPKNTYKMFTHAYQSYLFNLLLSRKIKNKASLRGSGNLIGYNSALSTEEKKLLEKEGISKENFKIKYFPEASVKGSRRKLLSKVKNFSFEANKEIITLKFDLEKGAYATVLLKYL